MALKVESRVEPTEGSEVESRAESRVEPTEGSEAELRVASRVASMAAQP